MPPRIFVSRFCRLEGPSDWSELPGAGLVGPKRIGAPRANALVSENWLTEPADAKAFAARQRKELLALSPKARALEERELPAAGGETRAWQAFSAETRDGAPLRQEQFVLVRGPLAACVTVTAAAAEWEGDSASPLRAILASFAVPDGAWLEAIRRAPLEPGTAPAGHAAAPRLGLSIPVPEGWSTGDDPGVLRNGVGGEIRLSRAAESEGTDSEFAAALSAASRAGLAATGWDRGRTAGGADYYALEAPSEGKKTWGAAPPSRRVAFVRTAGVLRIDGGGTGSDPAAFATVVLGLRPLPPEEHRARVEEPWLSSDLPGAWSAAAPGTFVRTAPSPAILVTRRSPGGAAWDALRRDAATVLSRDLGGSEVSAGETVEGAFRGVPSFRCSIDYNDPKTGEVSALRAAFFRADDDVCQVVVRGARPVEVERLFVDLVDRVDADALRSA